MYECAIIVVVNTYCNVTVDGRWGGAPQHLPRFCRFATSPPWNFFNDFPNNILFFFTLNCARRVRLRYRGRVQLALHNPPCLPTRNNRCTFFPIHEPCLMHTILSFSTTFHFVRGGIDTISPQPRVWPLSPSCAPPWQW